MTEGTVISSGSLAVIGGSGFYSLLENSDNQSVSVQTPFADAPVTVYRETTAAGDIWFLPRHGKQHSIAPHRINYRANVWALHKLGVSKIIAVNAVGGINSTLPVGAMVLPDQIIDYTWGREHTFVGSDHALDKHVDFTWPYDADLSALLKLAASANALKLTTTAVYAAVQGPRLETAAEIKKLQRDGCDIVGMTGMPEAALARESGLRYACIALVVNKAAGLGNGTITLSAIQHVLHSGMNEVRQLLIHALPALISL
jgi:5'-deoxy-5'-methylthioadenosine phosphorylase